MGRARRTSGLDTRRDRKRGRSNSDAEHQSTSARVGSGRREPTTQLLESVQTTVHPGACFWVQSMNVYFSALVWHADFNTPSTKLVALCLANFANKYGECRCPNSAVADFCGISQETVTLAIRRLVKDRWICREQHCRPDGGFTAAITRFNREKLESHHLKDGPFLDDDDDECR